jgi:hypothetical protein
MEESNFSGWGGSKLTRIQYINSVYQYPDNFYHQTVIRVGDRTRSQVKVHSVVNQYKFSQEMFSTIKVNLRETIGMMYLISYV